MSRDQLLGRALRAVLAVAGTAEGVFGGRTRRRQADAAPPGRPAAAPRPAPTPGLPPRIEREPTPGLPPRIEREPTAGLPPRIEREPTPALSPRIERVPGHSEPVADAAPEPVSDAAPEPVADAAPEPVADAAPEPAAEPRPAYQPKHVRASEPAPAPVRPSAAAARRAEPARSPLRAALRSHLWLAGIVLTVLAVVATGYWVLRVHQRIGEAALEHQIATRQAAPTVRCSALQSDGAAWACAVIYRAESVCLIARVNVVGSWSTAVGQHRCSTRPELVALLPPKITENAVAADIDQQLGGEGTKCAKVKNHKVRWVCQRPASLGSQCLLVRVVPWTVFNSTPGGRLCAHTPSLQKQLHAAA